jgi:hypothetical protein
VHRVVHIWRIKNVCILVYSVSNYHLSPHYLFWLIVFSFSPPAPRSFSLSPPPPHLFTNCFTTERDAVSFHADNKGVLDLRGRGLTSLAKLSSATGIVVCVDASENNIGRVEALESHPNIETLNLSRNCVSIVSPGNLNAPKLRFLVRSILVACHPIVPWSLFAS